MIPTQDPDTLIEEQRAGYVRYRRWDQRWEVHGTCVWTDPLTWGPCGQGASNTPIGPPEGRLDSPIFPKTVCALCIDDGHLRVVTL